jgi:hypothetical protein
MPLGGLVYLNWQYGDANTDPFQSDAGFHIYVYFGWDDMEWSLIGESTTTSFDYILGDFWWPEELCFKVTAVHNGEESEPSNIACAWDDPECEDLSDFDFGDCEMVIGIGFNGNECTWFSGCGTMDEDGIDHADSFFDSIDECVEICGQGNDDGPPECLMDCEGIFDIDPDVDPDATCVWLIETLNSDIECTTDCDDETLGFLMEVSSLCEQCLDGAFDCADIFDDDDGGGDEYGYLYGYVEYVWGDAIEMVAGAQILIQSISPDGTMIDVYETTTNDWGQYEIELPTGGYMVTASAYDDSETHVVYIEGGQEHELTFQLGEFYYPDIYALSGMVNGSDGPNDDYYPLPGAQIRAECISTGEVYETNAGEVGYYWLYLPFPDAYSVTVSHDGYQATTQIFEVTGIVEANFFLNSQGGVEAEAILSLGDGYGGPEGFTVPLYLNSSQSVSGLQFAVWPMLETWDYYFIPGEVEVLNDCFTGDGNDVYGQLWGIIFSLEGCVYEPGQDHHVANLSFTVEGDVPAGTQVPLVFNYTLVSDSDANEIPSMGEGSMVTFGQLGDVNGDGAINVVDIVNMVNFALQSDEPTTYESWASDLNEDGEINVLDIVSVINIILYGDDLLRSDSGNAEIYLGSAQVQVVGHDISGIQLTFDDMVNLREVSLPKGWTMNTHENTLIAYTLEGKVLNGRALFQLNQSAELIGVLIADANGEAVTASINVLPSTVALKGNYPNPFNPETTIQYEIAWDALVSLSVYDITGRLVEILINTNQYAGQHSILWTAQDEPSGMYIIRLVVDGESFTRKMMLMK